MPNRDRGTYVHRHGVTPETMSVISSKNKIYARPADSDDVEYKQIGVVASFNPSETRTIEPVRGIGFGDHVAELVPGVTDPMTLAVTRTAQYISLVYQVFGYKGGVDGIVRSLRHHKWPFDILQELVLSQLQKVTDNTDVEVAGINDQSMDPFNENFSAMMTYYEGCWMSDYTTTFAADTALVQEDVTIMVTDIIADPSTIYTEGSPDLFNSNAKSNILTSEYPEAGVIQNATV